MTSIISSRFDEALRAQIVEQAKATLASAQAVQHRRWRKRTILWASAPVGLGVLAFLPSEGGRSRSRVAFAQDNVISAESQGLAGGVEVLLPPSPPPVQPSPVAQADQELPGRPIHTHEPHPERSSRPCKSCRKEGNEPPAATESLEQATEELLPEPEPVSATPDPPVSRGPSVLNVGTRFEAVLDLPVQTAALGTPVSAAIAADVGGDSGRVLLPVGARVVGEAFATTADDRVQIVLSAVVADGRTVKLHGIALGPDGVPGLPGKMVRKGSKTKAGAGRVIGALGSALSFGVFGRRGGLVDSASAELARDAGRGLSEVEASWQRSDKVVRLPAGTRMTVYVREDTALPQSDAR